MLLLLLDLHPHQEGQAVPASLRLQGHLLFLSAPAIQTQTDVKQHLTLYDQCLDFMFTCHLLHLHKKRFMFSLWP